MNGETMKRNRVLTKVIKRTWNGRHGKTKYFVGISDEKEALFYAQKNFRFRPPCGDQIKSRKLLKKGDTVRVKIESFDGRYLGDKPVCFTVDGWIIEIEKHSCD